MMKNLIKRGNISYTPAYDVVEAGEELVMVTMSIKEFMNREYENSCVNGSESYSWLDVAFLVLFALWVGETI